MKKWILPFLVLLLVSSGLFAQPRPLTFATYTYATNNRLQNLEPLAVLMTQWLGRPVNAVSYPTVKALLQAIRADSVDFAMINTSGYLILERNYPGKATPLVNLAMGSAKQTNYGGCLLAARKSGITSPEQLKTKRVKLALVASSSTSGNLVPRLLLNSMGIPSAEDALEVYYAGTHRQVIEDLISGKAEAGGCGCAEARRTADFDGSIQVLAEYNNIPLGPILYRTGIETKDIEAVRQNILRVHRRHPEVFARFCQGWTEFNLAARFQLVTSKDYEPFRKLFGDNERLWELIE